MTAFIISILLLIIAAFGKAVCDATKSSWHSTIFSPKYDDHQWMNPSISWRNKWKGGIKANGERFFGSSTFLVWLTDLWHFSQLFWLNSIFAATILFVYFYPWNMPWWLDLLILSTSYKIIFESSYRIILNK